MTLAKNTICLMLALVASTHGSDDLFSQVVSVAEKAVVNAGKGDAPKAAVDAGTAMADMGKGNAGALTQLVGAASTQAEQPTSVDASTSTDGKATMEKTTQAVVKAVSEAEEKTVSTEDRKAGAVVDATMNVLKDESNVEATVPREVLEQAKSDATKTFEELANAKMGTNAAADAAAKVAVAEIDGASDSKVNKDVKTNAEEAAVAASEGVADHPNNLASALSEAISTVKKEEVAGEVDVTKSEKGVVASVVAETGALTASWPALCVALAVCVAMLARLSLKERFYESPYMKSLRFMREEESSGSKARNVEFTAYSEFP